MIRGNGLMVSRWEALVSILALSLPLRRGLRGVLIVSPHGCRRQRLSQGWFMPVCWGRYGVGLTGRFSKLSQHSMVGGLNSFYRRVKRTFTISGESRGNYYTSQQPKGSSRAEAIIFTGSIHDTSSRGWIVSPVLGLFPPR